ncbi:MAG: hypothetical protein ACLUG4_05285 [Bacilli bacterium]
MDRITPIVNHLEEQHLYVIQSKEGLKKVDIITFCRYGINTNIVVIYHTKNIFIYLNRKKDSGMEDVSIVTTHLILATKN